MQLTKISFRNFKCFEQNDFEIKKLTLITGANSSGKSSLLYGFLGAMQSGDFPFRFSPNGKYVNMGDFAELAHLHNPNIELMISFGFLDYNDKDLQIETYWKEDKVRKLPAFSKLIIKAKFYEIRIYKKIKYTLEFDYFPEKHEDEDLLSAEFALKLQNLLSDLIEKTESKGEESKKEKIVNQIKLTEKKIKDRRKNIKFTFGDFSELDKKSLSEGNYILQSNLRTVKDFIEELDKNLNFISSFRLYPERTYYEKSKSDLKIGKFGENYEDQIIAWETRNSEKYSKLLKALRNIKLLDNLETRRLEGGRYEVLVRTKKGGVKASLNDVGFGISQFLPILVSDLQLGKNSTLFIAQPEIHLHPSIQGSFGDYLVDNIKENNKNYLIETHSEYILNRVRLRIVKKEISAKDVKVYYLSNNGTKAKVYELEFTEKGEIKNAPKEFFDTYMIDVLDIANNID